MCGFCGIITKDDRLDLSLVINELSKIQSHRGPDMSGSVTCSVGKWRMCIVHQRLSILDLSEAGKQPMYSHDGRLMIAYNGEVYNYKELVSDLRSSDIRGGTDTEVMLGLIGEMGLDRALKLFNGMWAFALIDKQTKKLILCRDRAGIKPLYYTITDNGDFYFASEIKTILNMTGNKFGLNYQKVGEYLVQSLQDTDEATFFSGIHMVPSSHYMEFDLTKESLKPIKTKYWSPFQTVSKMTSDEYVSQFRDLFVDAVKLRFRSDVHVGVALSGGLDSSCIVAAACSQLGGIKNINVISAVTPGDESDESKYIDIVSRYFNIKVHKINLGWKPEDSLRLLNAATWHNDSPLGSFSNVAHYLMMQKANELGITVILSGQGGDELLCGYKKYLGFYLQQMFREKKYFEMLRVVTPFIRRGTVLNQFNMKEAKRYLPNRINDKNNIVGSEVINNYSPINVGLKLGQSLSERQYTDYSKYSVPFLTHYEDRMSMAFSREIRLPFLDYRIVELMLNAPENVKINHGWTKFVLRKAFQDVLPDSIVWRKDKQGFVMPQDKWLKNELKSMVLNVLNKEALVFALGLIDRNGYLEKYKRFCCKEKSNVWYRDVLNPLLLEVWLQKFSGHLSCC